ncbi:MAG: hypothetical protein ACFBSG_06295 [Leptolyngbyaceae cyanobacterium]
MAYPHDWSLGVALAEAEEQDPPETTTTRWNVPLGSGLSPEWSRNFR